MNNPHYILTFKSFDLNHNPQSNSYGFNNISIAKEQAQQIFKDMKIFYSVEIIDNETGELLYYDTLNDAKINELAYTDRGVSL